MALKPLDIDHFYLDDKLVDIVWISYQISRQSNAANHHEIKRNLNWLKNLAERLLLNQAEAADERILKRRLTALGLGWYVEGEQSRG